MLRVIGIVAGALLASIIIIAIVFILGLRTQSPPILDAIRRMNRVVFNPRQMRTAGTPGAYAAVIRHRGRSTGTSYETPVVAIPTDDGLVIALPYGTRPDWIKNVQASGLATVVHEGTTYEVTEPEVLPIDTANAHFSARDQRSHRHFGVNRCLHLRRAEPPSPTS